MPEEKDKNQTKEGRNRFHDEEIADIMRARHGVPA
jgi:hypothetical protein